MAWFKDQKLSAQKICQIEKMVIDCWNASYANEDVVPERTEDKKVCNILIDISNCNLNIDYKKQIWSKWD